MRLRANLRLARRLAALLAALLVCLPLHGLWRMLRLPSPWPPRFLGWAARACGVRARVFGDPLRRDVLFIANHQSWLDILVLGGALDAAFVSKAEIGRAPVIGRLASLNRTIYVDREDRSAMPDQVAGVRAALGETPVVIFPEGTTGDGETLLPFKSGLLQALDPPPPGVRAQPVLVDYGPAARAIAWTGEESGLANALRILRRPGVIRATVRCLEPLDPAAVGGRKAIAAEARGRIAAAIEAYGDAPRA